MRACVALDTRGRVGPADSQQAGQEGAAETCRGMFWPCYNAAVVFQAYVRDPQPISQVIMCKHKRWGICRRAHPAVTQTPLYEFFLYVTISS